MVTHSPHDAEYANRIINLFDGQIVHEEQKEEFHVWRLIDNILEAE